MMISHRFHRRKMDRRISLEIKRETVMTASFQLDAYRRCYYRLSHITVSRSVPNGPNFQRYKAIYPFHGSLEFKVSVSFFWIFYLEGICSCTLPEFENSGSRLNFTTSPPRDIKAEMQSLIYRWTDGNKVGCSYPCMNPKESLVPNFTEGRDKCCVVYYAVAF